jgi:hypothetical protein
VLLTFHAWKRTSLAKYIGAAAGTLTATGAATGAGPVMIGAVDGTRQAAAVAMAVASAQCAACSY